jgi:hypothetical protein
LVNDHQDDAAGGTLEGRKSRCPAPPCPVSEEFLCTIKAGPAGGRQRRDANRETGLTLHLAGASSIKRAGYLVLAG